MYYLFTGMLADTTGSYKWTFILSGAIGLLSLAVAALNNNLTKAEHESKPKQHWIDQNNCQMNRKSQAKLEHESNESKIQAKPEYYQNQVILVKPEHEKMNVHRNVRQFYQTLPKPV